MITAIRFPSITADRKVVLDAGHPAFLNKGIACRIARGSIGSGSQGVADALPQKAALDQFVPRIGA